MLQPLALKKAPIVLTLMTMLIVSLIGCSSEFVMIASMPPDNYESLGEVTGSASGSLGVLGTAYYCIPMGINGRVASAYENALCAAPGATGLINVTYEESWSWWVIGTNRTVTITGEAIREVKK